MVVTRLGRSALVASVALVVGLAVPPAPAGAAPAKAKSIVVTASPSSVVWSQTVRLTVAITPRGGGAPQGGTVTFLDGSTAIGTARATTRNTTLSTAALGPGDHAIRAQYSGDAATAPGTSAPITVTVAPAPTALTLTSTDATVTDDDQASFRAVVMAAAPALTMRRPTGTVTFTRGSARAVVKVNANGVATWRPRLPAGTHTVTATYDGSATHGASASGPVTQTVTRDAVVDQASVGERWGEANVNDDAEGGHWVGQIFVAGVTGQLEAVGLNVYRAGSIDTALVVKIKPFVGDDLSDTVIGSGQLPASAISTERSTDLIDIDLKVPAPVTAGQRYAVVIEMPYGPTRTASTWMGTVTGDGAPWAQIYGDSRGGWSFNWGADLMFRTWVDDD